MLRGSAITAVVIGVLLVAQSPVAPQSEQVITVGPTVRVSSTRQNDTHTESYIATDPRDARRLIACSMVYNAHDFPSLPSGASITVTYVSSDGGSTWEPSLTLHSFGQTWDPGCAYGADGAAYSISEAHLSDGRSYVELDRSADGGRTWRVASRIRHMERAQIVTDLRKSGNSASLFIYGSDDGESEKDGVGSGLRLFSSQNAGATFEENRLPPDSGEYIDSAAPGAVLENGDLVASFDALPWPLPATDADVLGPHFEHHFVGMFTMHDSGSYLPSRIQSRLVARRAVIKPSYTDPTLPAIAVDASGGPFSGRIYVVWNDWSDGRSDILLSSSDDEGKTWTPPTKINDDLPRSPRSQGPDDFMPVIAVNTFGVVGVSWYDRRAFLDNQGWSERFAASIDGGETFTPSVAVSSDSFDASRADTLWVTANTWGTPDGASPQQTEVDINHFTFDAGDTAGLAADAAGHFHPLWIANSSGTPQLYTANVAVSGGAVRNGSRELSQLRDVGKSVVLNYYQASYDRKTGILRANAFLQNVSDEPVQGPFTLRALSIRSELGKIEAVNADGGGAGAGAYWSMDPGGGVLRPGMRSAPRELLFRLPDNPSLSGLLDGPSGGRGYPDVGLRGAMIGLLKLTSKVLAPMPGTQSH
jgi:hypothetical protein